MSEVWGTEPTRRSERLKDQEAGDKVLITKVTSKEMLPEITIPRAYSDAISSPEGKFWKDAMDYELRKLEEMNTWDEINLKDLPDNTQVLPGMWVHTIKNLESKD